MFGSAIAGKGELQMVSLNSLIQTREFSSKKLDIWSLNILPCLLEMKPQAKDGMVQSKRLVLCSEKAHTLIQPKNNSLKAYHLLELLTLALASRRGMKEKI
jgi:hypothetical protein